MTETRKTLYYAGAALLLAGLAFATAPRQKLPSAFFDQGQQFFPDFKPAGEESRLGKVTCFTCHQGSQAPKATAVH